MRHRKTIQTMTAPFPSDMTLYRVWAKYEPDHINLAAGRKGQWRVKYCSEDNILKGLWTDENEMLAIPAAKPYPRGSIIRPHKELNRVLALRNGVANEALDKMNKERVYP